MKILEAKKYTLRRITGLNIAKCLYQGKIDITEYVDFQAIAIQFDLTNNEYEELINDTQDLVDEAIKNYFKSLHI